MESSAISSRRGPCRRHGDSRVIVTISEPGSLRAAGIQKRAHAHGLRHTHAYELMMEGVELAIIQRQFGHVSLATTAIYRNHIDPRQVIETMRGREWTL